MRASDYNEFKEFLTKIYPMDTPVWKACLSLLKIWSNGIQISIDRTGSKPANESFIVRLTEFIMSPYSWGEVGRIESYNQVIFVIFFDRSFDLIREALKNGSTTVL